MTSFSVTCGYGRVVTMSNAAWGHIQEEHDEVQAEAIKVTVEAPDFTLYSSINPRARIYYKKGADPNTKWVGHYCAVVVGFDKRMRRGWVNTAVYTHKTKWGTGGIEYGTRPSPKR